VRRRFAVLVGIVALSIAAVGIYLARDLDCATDSKAGATFALRSTEPIDPLELQAFLKSAGIGDVSISQTDDPAAVVLSSTEKTWSQEAILHLQTALKNFGDVQIARTELAAPATGCP
jgi:preprotein translocase subunit SecF